MADNVLMKEAFLRRLLQIYGVGSESGAKLEVSDFDIMNADYKRMGFDPVPYAQANNP